MYLGIYYVETLYASDKPHGFCPLKILHSGLASGERGFSPGVDTNTKVCVPVICVMRVIL